DPESQPEAAIAPAGDGPLESVEDAPLIAWRDADAVIAHRQLDRAGGGPDRDLDRLVVAVFHGVGKQVADHLLDPPAVPEATAIAVALLGDLESGPPRLVVPGRGYLADQRSEIDLLRLERELAGGDPGTVEQDGDRPGHPRRRRRRPRPPPRGCPPRRRAGRIAWPPPGGPERAGRPAPTIRSRAAAG